MSVPGSATYVGPIVHLWRTLHVTARMYMKRSNAYLIDIVRAPVGVLLIFVSWWMM